MPARLCAASILALGLTAAPAAAGIFGDAPDVIVCTFAATADRPAAMVAHYVDGRLENGTVIYKTQTAIAPQVTIGADGLVRAERLPDCHGMTPQQLRDAGRAFDFR